MPESRARTTAKVGNINSKKCVLKCPAPVSRMTLRSFFVSERVAMKAERYRRSSE